MMRPGQEGPVRHACRLPAGRKRDMMTRPAVLLQSANASAQSGRGERGQRVSPMDEDLLLIQRVAQHDRQAFELLYHRYARRLGRYLSRLLRQPELVEEVVDDV